MTREIYKELLETQLAELKEILEDKDTQNAMKMSEFISLTRLIIETAERLYNLEREPPTIQIPNIPKETLERLRENIITPTSICDRQECR